MASEEKKGSKAKFQTQTINGLVVLFYKNLISFTPKRYTTALSLCSAIAKRFDDDKGVSELEKISKYTVIGYPLGLIETIAYRDLMHGRSTATTYNYGWKRKPVRLGDLIYALDSSLTKILDIFTRICVEHDVDPQIAMPMLEGFERKEGSAL